MASRLNLGFSGLDSNSDRGRCFVFMDKKLSSYNTSLYTKASMSTYELLKQLDKMVTKISISKFQFDREFEGHGFLSDMTVMCYPS